MKAYSNENQRKTIKEALQIELLKRGFLAQIKSLEETKGRSISRFEFETEDFQTIPVLFKRILVANFSSSISDETTLNKAGVELRKFYISAHVRYEHFDGGTNGSGLFSISGVLCEGEVYGIKTN